MTGPENQAESDQQNDTAGGAAPEEAVAPSSDATDEPEGPAERWTAPRWLAPALLLVVVAALLLTRALLGGDDDEKDSAERELPPPEQVESAEAVAVSVLEAWAQPELDYDAWWEGLQPLLTPRAREGYAHTDPRRVPELTVVGEPRAVPGPTTDTVTITVGTDDGDFGVALYRSGTEEPWRAVQIVFPQQEGPFQ